MQLPSTDLLESIADNLAKQHYAIQDQFLSLSEVENILNVFHKHKQCDNFKKAGIGRSDNFQVDRSIRGDLIKWIDPAIAHPAVQVYLVKLRGLIDYLNRTCYLGIRDYEVHFTMYPKGTFYARHIDQFQDSGNRRISFICYLNPSWLESDGGQLRMHLKDGPIDILPTAGRLACFLSNQIEHEVLPGEKTRYSLTGWMLNQPKDVAFLT